MEQIIAAYLAIGGVALLAYMAWEHVRGQTDLFTTRNVCLIGLVIFQFVSGVIVMQLGVEDRYQINNYVTSGLKFSAMLTAWTLVFLLVYRKGWVADALARRVPVSVAMPGMTALWTLAVTSTVLAAAMKFGVRIPLIGVLSNFLALAFTAIGAGLAGWIWAPRLFNPVVAVGAVAIVGANAGLATWGEFGRRPLMGVGLGMLWGMYYSHWRYLPLKRMALQAAVVSTLPLCAVALQTSIRSWQATSSLQATVTEVQRSGDVGKGLMLLGTGQDTAGKSLFCLENFPAEFDYRPFQALWYFFVYPVPRDMWPDKPYTLSNDLPRLARIPGIPIDGGMTVGPGIVGQAEADGGWIALFVYAVLLAMVFRFFDRTALVNVGNPLLVLPVGSALGQVAGVTRGDMSQFMWIFMFGTIGSWAILFMLSKVIERFNPMAFTYAGAGHEDSEHVTEDDGPMVDAAAVYEYEHDGAYGAR
jgi:hypothetical protein